MKKFLLCMMLAGLMMPVVAQEKVAREQIRETRTAYAKTLADLGLPTQTMLPTTSRGTLVDVDGWKSAGVSENYDRQTQGTIYPMAKVHDDGFIGCVWTNEDNLTNPFEGSTLPFRGVGYSYSTDGGVTWSWNNPDNPEYQENRVGGFPFFWPSYAQWGKNGEVILARAGEDYKYEKDGVEMEILNGLVLLTRENKGVGEWNINLVPYPEGDYDPGVNAVMAWARMTTSGLNHQYIHIVSPMRTPLVEPMTHYNYYYRTQDGGVTWDIEAEFIDIECTDGIDIVAKGNTVAFAAVQFIADSYIMKSTDNGDNWTRTKFFNAVIDFDLPGSEGPKDSLYLPIMGGGIAIDNDGMVHLAFSVQLVKNGDEAGYYSYWTYVGATFLTYWNEDMGVLDGDLDFNLNIIDPLMWEGNCMSDALSDFTEGLWYVVSTVPEWPIIGYPIPADETTNICYIDNNVAQDWATYSYGRAGCFSFPQMTFDADNVLHLVYLGLLDSGNKGAYWLRHPFYTTTPDKGKTWTKTEYLVNYVTYVDQEFAYLTMGGISPDDKLFLMAQTDAYPGVSIAYVNTSPEHAAVTNKYSFFYIPDIHHIEGIPSIDYTPLSMQLFPNPASGQATVKFEGKGNITVYNMLGQTVYHVENVENQKDIPLNMASGVYFVTVRSGNATATQKLVVK